MITRTKDLYTELNARYPSSVRIFRYLLSGGISTGTDLVLLYVFTDLCRIWYLTSAVIAFILAFLVSFIMHKFWTFGDHSREGAHLQMGAFLFVSVVNLVLNTILVYVFVEWGHLYYLLAQIAASALIAIESFFIYDRFIFQKTITV